MRAAWARVEGWPRQAGAWLVIFGLALLWAVAYRGSATGWLAIADLLIVGGFLLRQVRRTLRIVDQRFFQGWGFAVPGLTGVRALRERGTVLPSVSEVWVEHSSEHYKFWSGVESDPLLGHFRIVVGKRPSLDAKSLGQLGPLRRQQELDPLFCRLVVDDEYRTFVDASERAIWLAGELGVQFCRGEVGRS
jgi:hypothetical protein